MNSKLLTAILISLLLISAVSAMMIIPANDRAKEYTKAPEKSPVISENELSEWELERKDFTNYVRPDKL